jgi:hypothetical protein
MAMSSTPPPTPTISEAMGGPLGIAESVVPATAFVVTYTASGQDTTVSAIVALVLGAILTALRLARRQTVQFALSGLIGVALAAFVATRTGRAEDFFLPSLLKNAGYALAYLISILVRRPLLGVVVGAMTGQGQRWREDPEQLRAYTQASWIWVAMFIVRLVIQVPFWLSGEVVVLGVLQVILGVPLFAITLWLSWLVLRGRVEGLSRRPAT